MNAQCTVCVTKVVRLKVINRIGNRHEVTFTELPVGLRDDDVELVRDPFLVVGGLFVNQRRINSTP